MEMFLLKNTEMFSYSEKLITKLCLLTLVILFISDNCVSIQQQTSNKTVYVHPLKSLVPEITSINTAKPICTHTRPDGIQTNVPCINKTTLDVNHVNITIANNLVNHENVSSINESKAIASHEKHNDTATINTSERSEIASMTDHSNKYTGGLDVDEKLVTPKGSDLKKNTDLTTQSSVNNETKTTQITDKKESNKSKSYSSDTAYLQNDNDFISKRLLSTTAAGIAAALCIALASLAYISLLVWRKISYKHYGNREMLINEDDLGDIHDEDMRHFEAACIQIET